MPSANPFWFRFVEDNPMIVIRSIVFTGEEREAFAAAQNAIDVAYPAEQTIADPKGKPVADPCRTVLGVLAHNAWDPATLRKIDVAVEAATTLRDTCAEQASPEFWTAQTSSGAMSPDEQRLAAVLMEARAAQRDAAAEALRILLAARSELDLVDDPRYWAELARSG